ncbi:MAG: NAD(P)/FAD-dependent oxidoreductase, partial [Mesorhizobium sp.]
FPAHLFNTCYTYLAPDDAFSNAISFKPVDGKLKSVISFVSKVEESSEIRRQAARAAEGWYDAFTHDVFG